MLPTNLNLKENLKWVLTVSAELSVWKAQFSATRLGVAPTIIGKKFINSSRDGGLGSVITKSITTKEVEPSSSASGPSSKEVSNGVEELGLCTLEAEWSQKYENVNFHVSDNSMLLQPIVSDHWKTIPPSGYYSFTYV